MRERKLLVKEAVILAAGYGKGLEPITHTRHKVLVPLLGRPLIRHHLDSLASLGVENFVVVVSYLKTQVEEEVRSWASGRSVDVRVVEQGVPLGTGHALNAAMNFLSSDRFILVYGDIYTPLEGFRAVAECGGEACIGAYEVEHPERFGVLKVEGGFLKGIVEKPENPPSNLINAGIYLLPYSIGDYVTNLEPSPRGEYELTDALTKYSALMPVAVARLPYWKDVGRPWSLLELNRYLLNRLGSTRIEGRMEDGVVVKGPVVIEEGAEILSGTYIKGPVYVGREASVGPNAYLRPYAIILEGAKVGFNVEVKESIVMEHAHAAHQAYIGDSIVGEYSNLGAGTILANLRFDGKPVPFTVKGRRESSGRKKLGAFLGGYVKTGVNVSTHPGVKIGAYSWINPGLVVKKDLPPCSHLKGDWEVGTVKEECRVDLSVWRP